jgi:hypothetical protein
MWRGRQMGSITRPATVHSMVYNVPGEASAQCYWQPANFADAIWVLQSLGSVTM